MLPFTPLKHTCVATILLSAFQMSTASENAPLVQSSDFVKDNIFTAGIEGPAMGPNGVLYAVNYEKEGTIGAVKQSGDASLFIELPKGSIANGIRFSKNGAMFVADYTGHNVLTLAPGAKKIAVFAHNSNMHQPNDLAITSSGILFASDPDWKNNKGQLWRINTKGKTSLLEKNMGTTNGVEVSTDEKHLYVNESVQRNIWVYDLDKKGNISNKQLFYKFDDHGLDGMRCDNQGNLYVARYAAGQIAVLSPKGKLIKTYSLKGTKPTNVAFGGNDGKTLFITMQDRGAIETLKVDNPGRTFGWFTHAATEKSNSKPRN